MSIRSQLFQTVSRRTIKRHGLDREQTVRHLRRVFNHTPSVTLLPRGVRVRRIDTPDYRGERLSVKNAEVTILYFHGGAFIGGVTRTYHNFAARLAQKLTAEVFLANYPFAPEHPYPAAVNCCLKAYEYLLDQGKAAENIIIAGDSAGGGLALSILLKIRDENLPLPRCAFVLSPATCAIPDEAQLVAQCQSDPMLSADLIRQIIDIYLPNKNDRYHPYGSPALGDFTELPPLMITVSRDELLYTDALMTKKRAEQAGVEVEWLERSGVFHIWPIMVPFLPEANRDFKKITRFIRRHGPVALSNSANLYSGSIGPLSPKTTTVGLHYE